MISFLLVMTHVCCIRLNIFLAKTDKKNMNEFLYVPGIEVYRDRIKRALRLSQKAFIEKVLENFKMKDCSPIIAPIIKGYKFSQNQYPKNNLKEKQMKNIPYASVVGSLTYAQVCTRPDLTDIVGILDRYQSNPGLKC